MTDAARQPGRVNLVNPDGELVSVDADKASAALEAGYSQPSDEQRRSLLNKETYGGRVGELAAGVAGAARTLSFGISDVLAKQTGSIDPEVLHGLKEANPRATTTGEVAGVVGSLAFGGGAGALGTGARTA